MKSGDRLALRMHFTPWTAMFAYFGHVADCYGSEPVDFLELGLSADSSYGAAIPDLSAVPFLTNSDAHSPCRIKSDVNSTGSGSKNRGERCSGEPEKPVT